METKIIDFLIQNFYGCVKFPSNRDKLNRIIPDVAGETGVIVIRNNEEDLRTTQDYLDAFPPHSEVTLITSRDFLSKKDELFSHYSLIFVDDFQKCDLYTLVILQEWYKKFLGTGETKIPYLLLGTLIDSYPKLPFPLKNFLDLTYSDTEPVQMKHSKDNFDLGYDDLYERLGEIILEDALDGGRYLVILPDQKRIDEMEERLNQKDTLLVSTKILYKTTRHRKPVVMLSTDTSRTGIFIEDLDCVYDSGEVMRKYTTRTGSDQMLLKKIDREELQIRRDSYDPVRYTVMIPKASVLNLPRTTISLPYRINLPPHMLFLFSNKIHEVPLTKNLDNIINELLLLNLINPDMSVTVKGEFCMNSNLDIYNSSFLYYAVKNNLPLFPVIVLVSIFHHSPKGKKFRDLYEIVTTVLARGKEHIPDNLRSLFETIDEFSDEFEISPSEKIFHPENRWNELLEHIPKSYLGRVCHYTGGEYRDGHGEVWKFPHEKTRDVAKLILPTSRYTNEKGENYMDYVVPLKEMSR